MPVTSKHRRVCHTPVGHQSLQLQITDQQPYPRLAIKAAAERALPGSEKAFNRSRFPQR